MQLGSVDVWLVRGDFKFAFALREGCDTWGVLL